MSTIRGLETRVENLEQRVNALEACTQKVPGVNIRLERIVEGLLEEACKSVQKERDEKDE